MRNSQTIKTPKNVLIDRVNMKLARLAKEAFDPDTAEDSDGCDQSTRDGILIAHEAVMEILKRA